MHYFPTAAVINYHKSFIKLLSYTSGGHSMKWVLFAKIKVLAWLHSFWRLWGKMGFLPSSACRDHPDSLASGSFPSLSHAKAGQITLVFAFFFFFLPYFNIISNSSLCFYCHIPFDFVSLASLFSLKRTLEITSSPTG